MNLKYEPTPPRQADRESAVEEPGGLVQQIAGGEPHPRRLGPARPPKVSGMNCETMVRRARHAVGPASSQKRLHHST